MLCRIKLFSNVHRTEIVLVMGRELTMGVRSTVGPCRVGWDMGRGVPSPAD